jgi:hypothetical protein
MVNAILHPAGDVAQTLGLVRASLAAWRCAKTLYNLYVNLHDAPHDIVIDVYLKYHRWLWGMTAWMGGIAVARWAR